MEPRAQAERSLPARSARGGVMMPTPAELVAMQWLELPLELTAHLVCTCICSTRPQLPTAPAPHGPSSPRPQLPTAPAPRGLVASAPSLYMLPAIAAPRAPRDPCAAEVCTLSLHSLLSSRVWAALAKKQETEQLGEEIWNIVSVTGLAGVAATVLGWAGTLLLF